ncbi:hypothetical protein RvY_10853 [Ramazzottius varieornatus]|uniref:THAP-type domain-containing protein n=1 Tax=Ramazzottius varieornatus TaxID=947166 RepID=A0A1D1VN37_RAMVA|nr:hypothetical protein RvY_10853 [Ramazzottius varieornatus]
MPRSGCRAAGCLTSYRSYSGPKPAVFVCPVGSRDEWIKVLPKRWEEPREFPKEIRVCERHFEPDLIIRMEASHDGKGNIFANPCKPKLKPGAIPTLFPEEPLSVHSKERLKERRAQKAAKLEHSAYLKKQPTKRPEVHIVPPDAATDAPVDNNSTPQQKVPVQSPKPEMPAPKASQDKHGLAVRLYQY